MTWLYKVAMLQMGLVNTNQWLYDTNLRLGKHAWQNCSESERWSESDSWGSAGVDGRGGGVWEKEGTREWVRYLSLGDKPERYGHGLTEERERVRERERPRLKRRDGWAELGRKNSLPHLRHAHTLPGRGAKRVKGGKWNNARNGNFMLFCNP
jgi:hypothetical protein